MYTHQLGVITAYLYENNSKTDELNEQLGITLDNQVPFWLDSTDEHMIGDVAVYTPKSQHVEKVKIDLAPGDSKLLFYRPLSSDGAQSKMSRSCNIVSKISPVEFEKMTKASGEVGFIFWFDSS